MRFQVAFRSLGSISEQGIQLGEDLLDRIEVGTVGRQEEQLCAGGADGATHGLGQEASAIDRPLDHTGSTDAVVAQRREEGQGPPAAVRSLRPAARRGARGHECASCWSWPKSRQWRPSERDQAALILFPLCLPPRDVGTILLAGVQAFSEAYAFVLEEVPHRGIADLDPTVCQLWKQCGAM